MLADASGYMTGIIGVVLLLIFAGSLIPVALNAFYGTALVSVPSTVSTIYSLIPIMAMVGLVVLVLKETGVLS